MSEYCGASGDAKKVEEPDFDKFDELYRPFLIHSSTYMILTEQILTLMPPQRNIILSMNEYALNEINPAHPNTPDSPTHVIIFCIRFIADDIFQPIGGLLVYKYLDQSAVLAECVKAYINDLWKLGLNVVATVSPSFRIFKGIISSIADIKDFDTHSGFISYSVEPIKEIIHIYDVQFLLIKLQNLFKDGDVKFEEETVDGKRVYQASWRDMSTVFNIYSEFKMLAEFLVTDEQISRRVHIFTEQIYNYYLEADAQGVMSSNSEGCAVLLNCVRSFLRFTEQDSVELNKMQNVDDWGCLIDILRNMTFQKSRFRTCTKDKSVKVVRPLTNPSIKKKIDFSCNENENEASKNNQTKVEGTNKVFAKSKKKNKNKKRVGAKAETKQNILERMPTKRENLAKIEGLCELLKNTESYENEDGQKSNEPTEKQEVNKKISTFKTEIILDIHDSLIEKSCDTDKNNNSDESDLGNKHKESSNNYKKQIRVRNDTVNSFHFQDQHRFSSKCFIENNKQALFDEDSASNLVDSNEFSLSDNFCSKIDDETERNINKSCDKVPNILDLLDNVDKKEEKEEPPDSSSHEYEMNPVTNELLSTIFGMRKLLELLRNRRVKVAKPDAFIVEHIDYLVTMIQERNMINPVHYYGHNYGFLNAALAFSTLGNNSGLYLVSKE